MPLRVPTAKPQKFHLFTPGQWKSGLEHWTGDRLVLGSNPAAATSLWNFGSSVYSALPVSFGGDTKSRRSLIFTAFSLYGPGLEDVSGRVYLATMPGPGEVKDPTQGVNG